LSNPLRIQGTDLAVFGVYRGGKPVPRDEWPAPWAGASSPPAELQRGRVLLQPGLRVPGRVATATPSRSAWAYTQPAGHLAHGPRDLLVGLGRLAAGAGVGAPEVLLAHPITAVQSEYSLWTRDVEAVTPVMAELGSGWCRTRRWGGGS
jgi:hypothetical protein